ncbi:MAG TPA: A24 family peptidase [Dehalococcoidia bacterium]|nr:A24 family peptidase [Dehalococcoidia bacterium]
MEPVLFFLLGLPLVYVANRLVVQLTAFDEDSEGENARVLPWQQGAWPGRVRWGVLLMLPPSMAVAGARFEFIPAIGVSLLLAGLLICTATDLLRFRVPNVVTYPGIVLALFAAVVMPDGHLASAFLAALLGGVLFLILAIFSRGGLGFGDVKLAVLIGAALGLPAASSSWECSWPGSSAAGSRCPTRRSWLSPPPRCSWCRAQPSRRLADDSSSGFAAAEASRRMASCRTLPCKTPSPSTASISGDR